MRRLQNIYRQNREGETQRLKEEIDREIDGEIDEDEEFNNSILKSINKRD